MSFRPKGEILFDDFVLHVRKIGSRLLQPIGHKSALRPRVRGMSLRSKGFREHHVRPMGENLALGIWLAMNDTEQRAAASDKGLRTFGPAFSAGCTES